MATRSLFFFMRPAEFAEVIWEAADKHDLTVIFQHYGMHSLKEIASRPGALTMADGSPVHNVYMSFHQPEPWMIDHRRTVIAPWGWLDIDVPREAGSMLFLSQMGASSHWWDEDQFMDNPESLLVFRKVANHFRKRLRRPVWAYNVGLGGEPSKTRDIWYSEGAAEWERGGGQLRAVGVACNKPSNVRFLIDEPAGPIPRPTAQELIQDFLSAPTDENLKWSIGLVLTAVADDTVFEQIVEIVRDRRHGDARQTMAWALGRMRDPRAVDVLIELLADDEVAGYAVLALGKLRATKARPYIVRLLAHPNISVKARAERALADIDKGRRARKAAR